MSDDADNVERAVAHERADRFIEGLDTARMPYEVQRAVKAGGVLVEISQPPAEGVHA